VLVGLATFGSGGVGRAQDGGLGPGPVENNLDVSHFEPRPLGFPSLGRAESQTWGEWAAGGFLHYGQNPLVLYRGRLQVGEVIAHRLQVDLVGSLGLLPWLETQLAVPFVVYQAGDAGLPTGSIAKAGLRDLRWALKATLLSELRGHPVGLALRNELSLPTGDAGAFMGDGALVWTPTAELARSFGLWEGIHFAANLGIRLRPRSELGNVEIDDEISWRLGAGLGLPRPSAGWRPLAFVELLGTTRLDAPFTDIEQNPLIGRVGLRIEMEPRPGRRWHATAGFGAGSTRGYGAPDYELLAGLVYERSHADRDGDGVLDKDDRCPDTPEDFDGLRDEDGCPEEDADLDGVPDPVDRCPNDPEDPDGFEDEDGCPDPDNDLDGIPDVDDGCPTEPEDLDGFDDEDGCPELDSDLDGVPDPDDRCPDEKETINGIDDEDGCPDAGPPQVEVTSEKVTIDSKIQFAFDSAEILEASNSILDQVALTLKANPQLRLVRVEGHTDARGSRAYNERLSRARAESVVAYLARKGVSRRRLRAVGYGEELPRVPGTGEAVWAQNRRVEFTILEVGPVPQAPVPNGPSSRERSTEPPRSG
jgi:large repetitive protein